MKSDNQITSAPIIGISMYDVDEAGNYAMPYEYIDAIRFAGGVPVCIAPNESNYDDLLASIDGCVLAGGGDINPKRYRAKAHESVYNVSDIRDGSEFTLAQLLLANNIPTLAICRGLQVINCTLGGTLNQHIPDIAMSNGSRANDAEQSYSLIDHRNKDESLKKRTVIHDVTLTSTSKLAQAYNSISFPIVSWHHQSIDELADGFKVVAVAADGIVEAIESPKYPNLLAVQWHPEMSAEHDEIQQRLFKHFVELAVENREMRL